jgi:hypothetical protein
MYGENAHPYVLCPAPRDGQRENRERSYTSVLPLRRAATEWAQRGTRVRWSVSCGLAVVLYNNQPANQPTNSSLPTLRAQTFLAGLGYYVCLVCLFVCLLASTTTTTTQKRQGGEMEVPFSTAFSFFSWTVKSRENL